MQVSFNLLSLLSAPQQWKLAKDGVSLADQKRLATQMAVLAQLHIARLQFGNAMNQYQRADEIAGVDQRIARHVDNQVRAQQAGLEQVSQQAGAILSSLRRYQALSNMQAAARLLQATLGLEPTIDGSDAMPLPELTAAVARGLSQWESGKLP